MGGLEGLILSLAQAPGPGGASAKQIRPEIRKVSAIALRLSRLGR